MLRELRIKNFAIIDDLTVGFESGLNVLTGETGAGKSIIVDALSLALGSRAQSDLIRAGEKSDGIILRRSISVTGKSKAYINDTIANLQSLAEVGKSFVDIHGQHEHQSLI